ncbi:acetamidase/formamidase family protein [soil metagenome]
MSNVAYFTTESYPASQRLDAWQKTLEHFSFVARSLDDDAGFASAVCATSPQGIHFARIACGPQELVYRGDARRGGVCLALHIEGIAAIDVMATRTVVGPGDIVYGSADAVGALRLESNAKLLMVNVPRAIFRSRLAVPLSGRFGRLSGRSSIGHVFAGLLSSIADTIENLTSDQTRPIEIALSELLVSSLADDKTGQSMTGTTSTQTASLHRISQMIESRLSDPELSITQIAAESGVSARYLQKLFESANDNFSHYVRLRRLERCRADLINPLYAHLSISDICFRWSFNDSAHFSRAFKEQYGLSPRKYRQEIGASLSTSMLRNMGRGWPELSPEVNKSLKAAASAAADAAGEERARADAEASLNAAVMSGRNHHYLPANAKTVHWGYFSKLLRPALEIESGDFVTIETLTHHANDDYERMVKGDSGAESVFHWTATEKNVDRRGSGPMDASVYGRGAGEGFGVHICTGPVAVRGAEPGDVIEIRILDVRLRPCANAHYHGRAFGSNAATWWGLHYKELVTAPKDREVVTIYEIDQDEGREFAKAVYNFRWTPQTDPYGVVHPTIDYPGVRVDHSTIVENHGILKNVRIPVHPHFGLITLAPREADMVDSIPPSYSGGNIDNRRAGRGSTMYLPVSVPGGLFSVGDPHASQGDGEVCGTAIETSMTGVFQLILHKKADLEGTPVLDLNYPLLETADEWVLHGFSYANYLTELGDKAQSEIYQKSSLDHAMRDAFRKMRRFLMTYKGLSEDEALSLMSVAVDFGVTQVVDGNWCVHAILRKELFLDA